MSSSKTPNARIWDTRCRLSANSWIAGIVKWFITRRSCSSIPSGSCFRYNCTHSRKKPWCACSSTETSISSRCDFLAGGLAGGDLQLEAVHIAGPLFRLVLTDDVEPLPERVLDQDRP